MEDNTEQLIREFPKVLLHDHLDGGIRITTVIDLAIKYGYNDLPTHDPVQLTKWFHEKAQRGNLVQFLEGFEHTCAVMQTAEALERVAYEACEDMKRDGVCYLETRFAPLFHDKGELTPAEAVEAVLRGLNKGKEDFGVYFGLILVCLRTMQPSQSLLVAELAVKYRSSGVVGFDMAGAEKGYPAAEHMDAFQLIIRHSMNITIHAGEAYGVESIRMALQECRANRIGHGTRLVEDMQLSDDRTQILSMGSLAQYVLDKRIPLEVCLTSNVHTGKARTFTSHCRSSFVIHLI
jgi:adenosine deaminase